MQNTSKLQKIAAAYESAALFACKDAEMAGNEPPRLMSVHLFNNAYIADFLAPLASLSEVRKAITDEGVSFRISFI